MKQSAELVRLSMAGIAAVIALSCSPVIERSQQIDYFKPIDQDVQKDRRTDSLAVTQKPDSVGTEDVLKDSLVVLYRQQNKRLADLALVLNRLTKKNSTGRSIAADSLTDVLAHQGTISNDVLLEKIRYQNRQLNDLVEQLKQLSQNQPPQSENHQTVPGAPGSIVEPPGAKRIPILIADANVLPVQSAPPQKALHVPPVQASITYGKAIELYTHKQYRKAIEVFKKLLLQKIDPNFADRYHFWMGVCYLNLNKSKQAIKEFRTVLGFAHSEKAEESYFMTGQCYEREKENKSAVKIYETMLQKYPEGNLKLVAEKKLALLR